MGTLQTTSKLLLGNLSGNTHKTFVEQHHSFLTMLLIKDSPHRVLVPTTPAIIVVILRWQLKHENIFADNPRHQFGHVGHFREVIFDVNPVIQIILFPVIQNFIARFCHCYVPVFAMQNDRPAIAAFIDWNQY